MNFTHIKNHDGKNLAIYQSEGTGKTILFVHANSLGAELYEKQFNSPLAEKYRLVAFDFPGHGNSDIPESPADAYTVAGLMKSLQTVIDSLQLSNYTIVGHSLGGHIILQSSENLHGANGFLIFGTPPLGAPPAVDKAFLPNPLIGYAFKSDLTWEEMILLASAFAKDANTEPNIVTLIKKTHPSFRSIFAASALGGGLKDETQIVSKLQKPIAILHGEEEQLVSSMYINSLEIPTLWKESIHLIPNAGHCPHWENPNAFNQTLEEFLNTIYQ